jgi:ERCC4-type nuclease
MRTPKPKPTILVDTKEQRPWLFQEKTYNDVFVKVHSLETGDYSLEGLEDYITVERKSLNDFVNTIIHDRERFDRELQRMADMSRALVIIEASIDQVLAQAYESKTNPHSVTGKALSVYVKHNIPVYFCRDRNEAQFICYSFLKQYWKWKYDSCEIADDQEVVAFHKKYNMDEIFGKEHK